MENRDREVIRRDMITQILLQHRSTATQHVATLINNALNELDRVEQAGMFDRISYEGALVHRDDDPATKRTRQILEAVCPNCGARVGDWCEYTTGRAPGSNPWLHVNRAHAADKLRAEKARQRLGEV